jgi:hypothetical protein
MQEKDELYSAKRKLECEFMTRSELTEKIILEKDELTRREFHVEVDKLKQNHNHVMQKMKNEMLNMQRQIIGHQTQMEEEHGKKSLYF